MNHKDASSNPGAAADVDAVERDTLASIAGPEADHYCLRWGIGQLAAMVREARLLKVPATTEQVLQANMDVAVAITERKAAESKLAKLREACKAPKPSAGDEYDHGYDDAMRTMRVALGLKP